ncbi:Peroxisome biogenesis factor 10 [Halotydeus destructor]|nr:Peroxisome biogenesis factor 10 [Halotydeus destructor]
MKPICPSRSSILRSVQKDQYYVNYYHNLANELCQAYLGPRQWIKWKDELDSLIMFSYYAATTLSGLQTLGEEYVRIVQVEQSRLKVPSLIRRLIMVVCQTMGHLIVRRLLVKLRKSLANGSNSKLLSVIKSEETRDKLSNCSSVLLDSLDTITQLNIALFYLNGGNYEISKQFSGISYTAIRSWLVDSKTDKVYKLLGLMTLTQLAAKSYLKYGAQVEQHAELNSQIAPAETETTNHERCSLCLEKRCHPTTGPCGHLFCWACIHSWLMTKAECPICREKLAPSRLVSLSNYG